MLFFFHREKRGFSFRPRGHLCCGLSGGRRKPANTNIATPDLIGKKNGIARTGDDIELITIGEVLAEAVNT